MSFRSQQPRPITFVSLHEKQIEKMRLKTDEFTNNINRIETEMLNTANRSRLDQLKRELQTIRSTSLTNCNSVNCAVINFHLNPTQSAYDVGKLRNMIDEIIIGYPTSQNKKYDLDYLRFVIVSLQNIKLRKISIQTSKKVHQLIDKVNSFLAQNNSRKYQIRSSPYANIASGNYKQKYLKYKTKYLELKKQLNITN